MHIKLSHVQNPGLFRTWGVFKILSNMQDDHAYLEPWHSQNCLLNCFQVYFRIFRDIDGNLALLSCVELGKKGKVSPAFFENRENCPDFRKKGPDYEVLSLKGISSTPSSPFLLQNTSSLNVWQCFEYVNVLITAQQFVQWPYVCATSDTLRILAYSALFIRYMLA